VHFLKSDASYLKQLDKIPGANKVSLCLLKPDDEALASYKINAVAQVTNTIVVYRDRKVTATLVNWSPKQLATLRSDLNKAINP
jgi:hypothetical protein